ncbi:hypothetical protein Fleli_1529 [Bernardetia litoralis DSM 6794]|uniref:Uncharacterized protein n=1 Tax=Bernardetia litoralis (strain ATCC 23117 / DSM 6794 / NBRC 15988 / NCIMB 1366 / Fx l1 / Sio-4) TaxID=880071 RepID=I4AJ16_BERLS|nr:hypothetical protein [Bernardetia litoralis]AFM03951.1 hypothetical protein Fleli_1529 [Bernardetia litoralis DSM 6794]
MEALEFKGKIERGMIRLPSEYKEYDEKQVRVIVLMNDKTENPNSNVLDKKEKIRLALQKMATTTMFSKIDNPVLWQKKLRDEWK